MYKRAHSTSSTSGWLVLAIGHSIIRHGLSSQRGASGFRLWPETRKLRLKTEKGRRRKEEEDEQKQQQPVTRRWKKKISYQIKSLFHRKK
jgi:hypothetical protein